MYHFPDQKDGWSLIEFDGWSEYTAVAERAKPFNTFMPSWLLDLFTSHIGNSAVTASDTAKSIADALEIAKNGWQQALQGLNPSTEGIVPAKLPKRRRARSEYDGELNVDRMLENSDQPFDSYKKVVTEQHQRVTIVFNPGTSTGANAAHYCKTVQILLNLVQGIELAGQQAEIVAIYGGKNQYSGPCKASALIVPIKRIGEPANVVCLSAIGHPAMYRILGYRVEACKEVCDVQRVTQVCANGWGSCFSTQDAHRIVDTVYPDKSGAVVVISGEYDAQEAMDKYKHLFAPKV